MTCTDRAMATGRLDKSPELVMEVTRVTACPLLLWKEGHIASFAFNTFAGLPSRRDAGTLGTTELRKTTESTVGPQPSDREPLQSSQCQQRETLTCEQEERGTPSGLPPPSDAQGLTQLCCHLISPASSSTRAVARLRTPRQKNTFWDSLEVKLLGGQTRRVTHQVEYFEG